MEGIVFNPVVAIRLKENSAVSRLKYCFDFEFANGLNCR